MYVQQYTVSITCAAILEGRGASPAARLAHGLVFTAALPAAEPEPSPRVYTNPRFPRRASRSLEQMSDVSAMASVWGRLSADLGSSQYFTMVHTRCIPTGRVMTARGTRLGPHLRLGNRIVQSAFLVPPWYARAQSHL